MKDAGHQKMFYKDAASQMSVKDKTRSKAAWRERVRFQMEGVPWLQVRGWIDHSASADL